MSQLINSPHKELGDCHCKKSRLIKLVLSVEAQKSMDIKSPATEHNCRSVLRDYVEVSFERAIEEHRSIFAVSIKKYIFYNIAKSMLKCRSLREVVVKSPISIMHKPRFKFKGLSLKLRFKIDKYSIHLSNIVSTVLLHFKL